MVDDTAECPFCGFTSNGEYAIQLHIEEHHTEDSPFVVNGATPGPNQRPRPHDGQNRDNGSSGSIPMPTDTWTKCTRPGCGEHVLLADVDEHLQLHEAAAAEPSAESPEPRNGERRRRRHGSASYRDPRSARGFGPASPRKSQKAKAPSTNSNGNGPTRSILEYFAGTSVVGNRRPPPPTPQRRRIRAPPEPGRLGTKELGPHAFEKVMPDNVRRHLLNDAQPYQVNRIGRDGRLYPETVVVNETPGLIPIIADLCSLDPTTEATYLCDPSIAHVVKLKCDGNFCGYWNIQMLLSYLQRHDGNVSSSGPSRQRHFRPLPHIPQIQDTIEQAWDSGICSYGRIETGGVRGTRKWIGTHEALAYFTRIGVNVEALAFKDDTEDKSSPAVNALLDHVEAYFMSGLDSARSRETSHITALAPVYFQRFGHSMTIVGLERKDDGSRNLLVFDPSFATSEPMHRFLRGQKCYARPETVLRAYRRSEFALSRWEEFEVLIPQIPRPQTGGGGSAQTSASGSGS